MKRILTMVVLSALLLASCNAADTTESSDSSVETSVTESSESAPESSTPEFSGEIESAAQSNQKEENVTSESSDNTLSNEENIGNEDWCYMHNLTYHTYGPKLVEYVGTDNYHAWQESNIEPCSGNIVSFVEHFNISKEKFLEIYEEETAGLTDEFFEEVADIGITRDNYFGSYVLSEEQIDAIYSGDDVEIENVFAGNLSVTASDGNRYSLLWLEKHSPEDYLEAGISPESIDALVDEVNTNSDYTKYRTEMQALSEQANQAAVMMESAAE